MSQCDTDLIDAAIKDRLSDQQSETLRSHLRGCQECRRRLEHAAAPPKWWDDAQRLLDLAVLDDPSADVADSSTADARVFEADDPVSELKAAGVIDAPAHPEMLGKLGRYSIEREIGTGGMGVVLKGYDAELNRTVAIKVLAPHLARSGAARQRFIREGRAAAAVVHENVVAIHEVDTSGKLPTLVMRYVDGVSLQRRVDTVGPLPICDALRIAAQTAAGLAAAHRQGIVHRDVKPANILVSAAGQRIWITDFGLARAVDDASLTRTGFIAGTPHYMSPEQARGGSVGQASDLFSFGGVLYFMLSARPPWRAERSLAVLHRIVQEAHRPLWQLNPDVPREVSDLVDELLSKAPQDRGTSAEEVQRRLESILSDLQNPAGPHSLTSEMNQPPSARQSFFAKPIVLAPLTAALTIVFMTLMGQVSPRIGWRWTTSGAQDVQEASAPVTAPPAIDSNQEELDAYEQSDLRDSAVRSRLSDDVARANASPTLMPPLTSHAPQDPPPAVPFGQSSPPLSFPSTHPTDNWQPLNEGPAVTRSETFPADRTSDLGTVGAAATPFDPYDDGEPSPATEPISTSQPNEIQPLMALPADESGPNGTALQESATTISSDMWSEILQLNLLLDTAESMFAGESIVADAAITSY